jgi:hypothetical protein
VCGEEVAVATEHRLVEGATGSQHLAPERADGTGLDERGDDVVRHSGERRSRRWPPSGQEL